MQHKLETVIGLYILLDLNYSSWQSTKQIIELSIPAL